MSFKVSLGIQILENVISFVSRELLIRDVNQVPFNSTYGLTVQ